MFKESSALRSHILYVSTFQFSKYIFRFCMSKPGALGGSGPSCAPSPLVSWDFKERVFWSVPELQLHSLRNDMYGRWRRPLFRAYLENLR